MLTVKNSFVTYMKNTSKIRFKLNIINKFKKNLTTSLFFIIAIIIRYFIRNETNSNSLSTISIK